MRFLVDNQLPQHLTEYLRKCGHDAIHVIDLELDEADDSKIWERCLADNYVLISKDEDFFFLASRPGDTGRFIWIRLGNCRNFALIAAFDLVLSDVLAALENGQRIIEIR
jgi:predicted nuclease of predicted toxin-antitoxin system